MINRESESAFVMTRQNDHAQFSEEVARGLREEWFLDSKYRDDCLLAIREHDRSWIRMDDVPIWNDRSKAPFSFIDYPVLPKLAMYRMGLDETEEMSYYAALLCSMYYASFFQSDQQSLQESELAFYQSELARQKRLREKLNAPDEQVIARHFQLLQLCDNISLYVCMNREGIAKEEEHPWFKDGFNSLIDGQKFVAEWVSDHEIRITPQLFTQEWSAVLRNKHVPKQRVREVGIHKAYQESDWTELKVTFV